MIPITCRLCDQAKAPRGQIICQACQDRVGRIPQDLRRATPEQLLCYAASAWQLNCVCGCDVILRGAASFDWQYHPTLPLTELARSAPDSWAEFWKRERAWRDEYDLKCGSPMEEWWLSDVRARESLPIVVAFSDDEGAHVWDGCHRIGISCLAGHDTVPAVVGTLPSEDS